MNVLVYFDAIKQAMAQRTVALLAEKFVFDADLLVAPSVARLNEWSKIVRGTTKELRIEESYELAVAKACTAKHYDLVVAAPKYRSGLVRLFLGSRISRLVGAAPATIWVSRGQDPRLQRIVVGVSGGPQSEQDARLAARLALAYNARLELAHVVSQVPLFYTTFAEFQEAMKSDASIAMMDAGITELRRIYSLLKEEGVQVDVLLRFGAVADELISVCHGDGKQPLADLLVIGAHAPAGTPGGDYLENLTEEISRSVPCPTLVVHAISEWEEWKISERDVAV